MVPIVLLAFTSFCLPKWAHSQDTMGCTTDYGKDTERFSQLQVEVGILRQLVEDQNRQLSEMKTVLLHLRNFVEQLAHSPGTVCSQNQPRRQTYQPSTNGKKLPSGETSVEKKARLIKRLDITDRWAYGITKLRDKIYILCYNPNSLLISMDEAPFSLRLIPTEQVKKPFNIAASLQCDCVFIIDIGEECIWKMTAVEEKLTVWLTNMTGVHTLSVTNDGRVLVIRNDEDEFSLEIYGSDALLTDRIQLSNIDEALYALQTPTNTFFVSHRSIELESVWVISELDGEGNVLNSSTTDDDESRLDEPIHLFLFSTRGVFVADRLSSKVLLFNADLKLNQTVLSELDGLDSPFRLYYDEEKSQLIVIHGASGGEMMDIYSFD